VTLDRFILRASLTVFGSGAEVGGMAPSWTDASVHPVTPCFQEQKATETLYSKP
jgi:hypothetical protein